MQASPYRVAHTYLLRLADSFPGVESDIDLDVDLEAVEDQARRLYSGQTRQKLIKAFGRRGVLFFELYPEVYKVFLGGPGPEGGLEPRLRATYRILYRYLTDEEARNQFSEFMTRLKPLLKRIDGGTRMSNLWRQVVEDLVAMINVAARDKNLYFKLRRIPGGGIPWTVFQVMKPREERLERLKDDDPELFARLMESEEVRERINNGIKQRIAENGLVEGEEYVIISGTRTSSGKMKGYGRPVLTGTDPVTHEVYYFDEDGQQLGRDEYIEQARARMDALKGLRRVHLSDRELDEVRRIPTDIMDKLADKPVRYASLTDDPTKSTSLTRIYPVIDAWGVEVIASGKFRGMALADVVNRAGRQIEGSIFDYDPKTGRPVRIETRNPDGTANVRVMREPYVTSDKKGLLLNIPGGNQYAEMRNALKKLANLIPSIEVEAIPGTRAKNYRFDPKDFAIIRETVGGMALSNRAMLQIKAHFEQLAKNELATAADNLRYYEADRLGGFGWGVELSTKQKQALAWLDSNGNKGVCALDTGMGKTLTSIAIMKKLERDGLLDDPEAGNGRYLYVCPASLTGNLAKEMAKFLVDPDALMDRVDVMSYTEFRKKRGKMVKRKVRDPNSRSFGKVKKQWVPTDFGKDYVAIFFDEAQALKNPESQQAMAAMTLDHPRKILMTASPMERSPQEVYTLTAISNNINLTQSGPRKERRKFMQRFAESVGGRVVGIRQDDPVTARDFRVWVKQNLYFADKRAAEDVQLPKLISDGGTAITMPPEIEGQYRTIAATVVKTLRAAMKKFKGDPRAMALAVESLKIKLGAELAEMNRLSNLPNWTWVIDPDDPKGKRKLWTRNPDKPNPKVEHAADLVADRCAEGGMILLFTDSPEMATESIIQMSQKYPGRAHLVGYSDRIELWVDGTRSEVFKARRYKDESGEWMDKGEWKVHVLQNLSRNNNPNDPDKKFPSVATATLTGGYAVGQNLQMYSTVIHLDRDTWNSETMKQRTARAWRQGQDSCVEEFTLDMTYSDTRTKTDETLDEVRKVIQEIDTRLFDEVVVESQTEVLAEEWLTMKRNESALYEVDRRIMEMMMSPYVARTGEEAS